MAFSQNIRNAIRTVKPNINCMFTNKYTKTRSVKIYGQVPTGKTEKAIIAAVTEMANAAGVPVEVRILPPYGFYARRGGIGSIIFSYPFEF